MAKDKLPPHDDVPNQNLSTPDKATRTGDVSKGAKPNKDDQAGGGNHGWVGGGDPYGSKAK